MKVFQSLLVVAFCGTAAYCAMYEEKETAETEGAPASGEPALKLPKNSETLTAILPPRKAGLRAVGLTAAVDVSSPAVQKTVVDEINRLRRQAGATNMMKVTWDKDAQSQAQAWAEKCIFDHPTSPTDKATFSKTTKFSLGQNIAMGTGPQTWNSTMKMWYDELKDFKFGQNPTGVVGHYTALVWAASNVVGCGYKLCPAGKMAAQPANFFVCNFGPAGNVAPNQYKPFEGGKACAKCPNSCENGLCTNPCPYNNEYSNCEVASGMQPLFPNGCANVPAQYEQYKAKCQATCNCKTQGLLYAL